MKGRTMQDGAGDGRTNRSAQTTSTDDGLDRGLIAIRDVTAAYTEMADDLRMERAANSDLELRLSLLHDANVALQEQVELNARHEVEMRADIERAREEVRAQIDRADRLLVAVKEMHRALYSGSTAEYVLRAAMQLTNSERGYYVARHSGGLMIRACVDVPGEMNEPPSAFIEEIALRVLDSGDSLCWRESGPPNVVPPGEDEQFKSGAAVPVSVHGEPHGVIIVLDKDGFFEQSDIDSMISVGEQAGVAVENSHLRREVQQAYLSTIAMLADTVQAKDPYVHGHCQQVSKYARLTAENLKLDDDNKRVACFAALLHDVGKIGVSDGVLNKPGPLLAEERRLVEAHVRIGHDLLNGVPALKEVASAVLYHHERYDGRGYPEGLAGEAIPIASRIVAVVDAYCAMLDRRSYKEPYSPERAREELERGAGTQFDPAIVTAALAAIDRADGEVEADDTFDCGVFVPTVDRARARSHSH